MSVGELRSCSSNHLSNLLAKARQSDIIVLESSRADNYRLHLNGGQNAPSDLEINVSVSHRNTHGLLHNDMLI